MARWRHARQEHCADQGDERADDQNERDRNGERLDALVASLVRLGPGALLRHSRNLGLRRWNPVRTQSNALSQKRPTSVVHRVGDRSKPRDCSTSGISVGLAPHPAASRQRAFHSAITQPLCVRLPRIGMRRNTIVVPALYACIVAAALHLNGKGEQSCRQVAAFTSCRTRNKKTPAAVCCRRWRGW
jgi:hypothetical protein